MLNFLKSLFMPPPASGATAKERLKLVLLSDHLSLAPDVVDSLKRDLLEVISRYVEIDFDHADVTFEQRERDVAMLANIPITGLRERPPSVVPASHAGGGSNGSAAAGAAPGPPLQTAVPEAAPAESPAPDDLATDAPAVSAPAGSISGESPSPAAVAPAHAAATDEETPADAAAVAPGAAVEPPLPAGSAAQPAPLDAGAGASSPPPPLVSAAQDPAPIRAPGRRRRRRKSAGVPKPQMPPQPGVTSPTLGRPAQA